MFVFTAIVTLGMQYTTHGEWSEVVSWLIHYPQYFVLTIFFIGGAYYLLASGINFFLASVFIGVLSWVWGMINYLKFTMRDEYVTGDEVLSFFRGELTFSKEDVAFSKHLLIYGGVVLLMAVAAFLCQYFWANKKDFHAGLRKRFVHMLCGLLITILTGFGVYFTENIYDYMSDGEKMERKYGLMLSFIPSNTCPHLISNADYKPLFSTDYVREGKAKLTDIDGTSSEENRKKTGQATIKPNVIIIMSESLYDTDYFDNVETDKNPMAIMHRYQ